MTSARPTEVNASALEPRRHFIASDLFPELLPDAVPARWPMAGTRADEALHALLQGPQNQAAYPHGWRLAASIKSLEYDGWRFTKRDIHRPGCRSAITEYALDRQDPATAAALRLRRVR